MEDEDSAGTGASQLSDNEADKNSKLRSPTNLESIRTVSENSSDQSTTSNLEERVEVDRGALEDILDIGHRLRDSHKKSKVSMSLLTLVHESYKDKQVNKLND
uniref:Uncharacterized protein n=1 Tax=Heliothis virescens TaxID=7102 RepID=A0A2A4JTK3_HELVI